MKPHILIPGSQLTPEQRFSVSRQFPGDVPGDDPGINYVAKRKDWLDNHSFYFSGGDKSRFLGVYRDCES